MVYLFASLGKKFIYQIRKAFWRNTKYFQNTGKTGLSTKKYHPHPPPKKVLSSLTVLKMAMICWPLQAVNFSVVFLPLHVCICGICFILATVLFFWTGSPCPLLCITCFCLGKIKNVGCRWWLQSFMWILVLFVFQQRDWTRECQKKSKKL